MANQQKYFIGPSLLSDIRSTIQRVDAIAPRTSGPAQEVRLQGLQQPDGSRDIRVGKTDEKWAFGTCATITIFEGIPEGSCPLPTTAGRQIQNVINLTRDVPAKSWVVICRAPNGRWHLAEAHDRFAIRVGKVTSEWAIGTCASVNVWEAYLLGSCQPITGESTGGSGEYSGVPAGGPPLTIENVANLSFNVPANSWVVIGRAANDRWYLISAGQEGSCRKTIGGEDITKWPGWAANKEQILGHDASGCLKWFDTTECEEGTGP